MLKAPGLGSIKHMAEVITEEEQELLWNTRQQGDCNHSSFWTHSCTTVAYTFSYDLVSSIINCVDLDSGESRSEGLCSVH